MRAIVQDRYGDADVLELRDVGVPALQEDGVLVRVRAAGVEPGVWHLMTGMPYLLRLGFGLRRPRVRIRGRDVAGIVESAGAHVTLFEPGDEVFGTCEGSFAEFVCARPDRLAPKPANLGFEAAAVVPVSGTTALQALRDAGKVERGQKVLIVGAAGGIGTFTVQLANAFGAEVTGVCSTANIEFVRSLGAHDVVDYTQEDLTSRGQRYDLVLDIAGRRPLSLLRRVLAPRGTLVVVGGEGGDRFLGGFDRGVVRAPVLSLFTSQKLRPLIVREGSEHLLVLKELIEAGKVSPVVDRVVELSEVPDAIRQVATGHSRGKTAVAVSTAERWTP